ncbi:MAG: hypothetical protein ACI8RD_006408, partial [Bacillariaceae sp.]
RRKYEESKNNIPLHPNSTRLKNSKTHVAV